MLTALRMKFKIPLAGQCPQTTWAITLPVPEPFLTALHCTHYGRFIRICRATLFRCVVVLRLFVLPGLAAYIGFVRFDEPGPASGLDPTP